jgi:hypothetical protein
MKISPEEIRVVAAGPMLCLYRDRTLIEELDSLRQPTGILHACGLFRTAEKTSPWIPGKFSFRKEKAKPVALEPTDKVTLEWLLAGVILGERTVHYRNTDHALYIDETGNLWTQANAAIVWRDWLNWRKSGSQGTFARFTLRKETLIFGEDQCIHKIVQGLGLSVAVK